MRFEPRLMRGAEVVADESRASGALDTSDQPFEFPPELAALAEQLGADADHLTDRYPANHPAQTSDIAAGGSSNAPRSSRPIGAIAVASNPVRRRRGGCFGRSSRLAVGRGATGPEPFHARDSRALRSAIEPRSRRRNRTDWQFRRTWIRRTWRCRAKFALTKRARRSAARRSASMCLRTRCIPRPTRSRCSAQLNGFEKVIAVLQTEIAARKQTQTDEERLIESLRAELAQLKSQHARDSK